MDIISRDSEAIVMSQLLYHLGLKPPISVSPSLYHTPYTIQLDHNNPALREALSDLDKISIRPLDWILTFYVRPDDTSITDFLSNTVREKSRLRWFFSKLNLFCVHYSMIVSAGNKGNNDCYLTSESASFWFIPDISSVRNTWVEFLPLSPCGAFKCAEGLKSTWIEIFDAQKPFRYPRTQNAALRWFSVAPDFHFPIYGNSVQMTKKGSPWQENFKSNPYCFYNN